MPDVSIIIPVYNRVELLRDTLTSCAIQTFGDCEILIIDDDSEQDIYLVIDRARRAYGASCLLRYIRQPRRGAPAARNRGFREATGRFIQFLDSDDLLHPQKIEILRKCLLDRPELDMAFGLDEFFHEIPGDMGVLWNTPDEPSLDRFLWDDVVWHTGSPLWRRAALERVGPWDERLLCFQDWEYHIRALCRGIQYAHVPRVLQYLREHGASRISTSNSLRAREYAKLEAAIGVAREMSRNRAWSSRRSDALAFFLLQIVLELRQIGKLNILMGILAKAVRYAGNLRLRLAALSMLTVAALTSVKKGGRRDSIATIYQLANRFGAIPTRQSNWKRSASPPAEVPAMLLEILEPRGYTASGTRGDCI
jgi:glycosyltransferase involved in cell wall biosynthesis